MRLHPSLLIVPFVLFSSGCGDAGKETEKAKAEAASKARAEAAKKEMDGLPKTFSTPDYYKKNEPVKAQTPGTNTVESQKK